MVVFEKVALCFWISKNQSNVYQKIYHELHAIAFFDKNLQKYILEIKAVDISSNRSVLIQYWHGLPCQQSLEDASESWEEKDSKFE